MLYYFISKVGLFPFRFEASSGFWPPLFTHEQKLIHISLLRIFTHFLANTFFKFSFQLNCKCTFTQQFNRGTDAMISILPNTTTASVFFCFGVFSCSIFMRIIFLSNSRFSFFQTDVSVPQFQHHRTEPHGTLQRVCRSGAGRPEPLALSGGKVGHVWQSRQ